MIISVLIKKALIIFVNPSIYMKKPSVSIITVNYNQSTVTLELLQSIRKLSYPHIEVIVVDNGSDEDMGPLVAQQFPEVKYIRSEANLGFAGGNNLGIEMAKGDYLFFVNNDTEIEDGCIEWLTARFLSSTAIGVVSPKIRYFHHRDTIQYAGFSRISPITARNKTFGKNEKDKGQWNIPDVTHYAHGAAMMVSRKVIEKAGKMPEDYFLYYEEMDWCEQIKRAGFEIWYEPAALIYHKESISVGKASPLKSYYLTRNRILFMRRNANWFAFGFFCFFFVFFALPKALLGHWRKGEQTHLEAVRRAVKWHFQSERPAQEPWLMKKPTPNYSNLAAAKKISA